MSPILVGIFEGDDRVWDHIDLRHRDIFFDRILANPSFSKSESELLTAAASLWKGSGYPVDLGRVAYGMDDRFLRALLLAIETARS